MALGLGVGLELAPYLCEVRLEGDLACTGLLDGLLRGRVGARVRVRVRVRVSRLDGLLRVRVRLRLRLMVSLLDAVLGVVYRLCLLRHPRQHSLRSLRHAWSE